MNNMIPFHYQGQPVRFNSDGWINATDVAKRYGKKPSHWLELTITHNYMAWRHWQGTLAPVLMPVNPASNS